MKKSENHTKGKGISDVFLCDLHMPGTLVGEDLVEKILGTAASLPEDAFLGLRFDFLSVAETTLHCFTSENARATLEDIEWIFSGFANVEPAEGEKAMPDLFEGRERLYMFVPSERYKPSFILQLDHRFGELLRTLQQFGAILNINLYQNGSASLIIAINDELRLRLGAALAPLLPGAVPIEIDLAKANERLCGELSGIGTANLFAGLCLARMSQRTLPNQLLKKPAETDDDDDFDFDDLEFFAPNLEDLEDEPCASTQTPLEELELGALTAGILARAGITSVEALQKRSTEELMGIRNLGRRRIAEIGEKLEKWSARMCKVKPNAEASVQTLDELIGLGEVKEQVRMIKAYAKMKRDMERRGMNSASLVLNMQFVGNPGTAKTTVARILAGIFHDIGLLESAEPVEVGRSGLVGKYLGETAQKVREVFERADGRLLFIDEAYSLVDDRPGLYGDEAITAIVQEMENRRERTVVIFAGYPAEMEGFIDTNPGLSSRVPFTIRFSDYSPAEMGEICVLEAKRRSFTIADSAKEKLLAICADAALNAKAGNGRFCRNLVESAILRYAETRYGEDAGCAEPDFILESEHFIAPEGLLKPKQAKSRIGFVA